MTLRRMRWRAALAAVGLILSAIVWKVAVRPEPAPVIERAPVVPHTSPNGATISKNLATGEPGINAPIRAVNRYTCSESDPLSKGPDARHFSEGSARDASAVAEREWKQALLNAGDLKTRAVGLVLDAIGPTGKSPEAPGALTFPDTPARDELVQLAAGTTDPALYVLALGLCGGEAGPATSPACLRLSFEQWVRLDPNNALAWLHVASVAEGKGDAARALEAFHRASAATTVNSYGAALFDAALSIAPPLATPIERAVMAKDMNLAAPYFATSPLRPADSLCSEDAVRDVERRDECGKLANLLVNKGATLIEAAMGSIVGQRVGWSPERVAGYQAEARMVQSGPTSDAAGTAWDCRRVAGWNVLVEAMATKGERAAFAEWAQWAAEH